GDVETRPRLELDLLDGEFWLHDAAGDDRVQIGPVRERREAEHLEQLLPVLLAARGPIRQGMHVGEATTGERGGFGAEVVRNHALAAAGVGRRGVGGGAPFRGSDGGEADDGEKEEGLQVHGRVRSPHGCAGRDTCSAKAGPGPAATWGWGL